MDVYVGLCQEIGFVLLMLIDVGCILVFVYLNDVLVLYWYGDMFDLLCDIELFVLIDSYCY